MTEGLDKNSAGSHVSDETLRSYLLCRLSESDRLDFDQRLLIDDAFAQRVELAEEQLIDDFVSSELESADRELFANRFLSTEARRQKLRLATGLQDFAGLHTQPRRIAEQTKPGWVESLANLFSFKPTAAWAAAGSFALLLLLLGGAWLLSARRPQNEQPLAKQSPPATSPQPDSSPAEIAQAPEPTPATVIKVTPEPAPPVSVASVVLMPGTLRGGGEIARVAIPRGEHDLVRISTVLESPEQASYDAEVATAEGQTVVVKSRLKPHANGHFKVTFELPARLLQSGDYQVRLSRQKADGQSESVGRYYFRAQK